MGEDFGTIFGVFIKIFICILPKLIIIYNVVHTVVPLNDNLDQNIYILLYSYNLLNNKCNYFPSIYLYAGNYRHPNVCQGYKRNYKY